MELAETRDAFLLGAVKQHRDVLIKAVQDRALLCNEWYLDGDEMAGREWVSCQELLSILYWDD